jgi:hypothetical protein
MVHNPEVQKKGQQEADQALGRSRLPDFTDRDSMPYIEAMIIETMRWHAITPLGELSVFAYSILYSYSIAVPHRAIRDDEYNGYKIPAGKPYHIASTGY